MATPTDITVFCIANTKLNHQQIYDWVHSLGVTDRWNLPSEPSEPETLVGLAAKRCYLSFEVGLNENVTKIRKDWFDYLTNILKSGHGSVLEHASYTFAIEGVSRVFTAEMNRHRAGMAISEGSMRYIRLTDLKYWLPDMLTSGASTSWDRHSQLETIKIFKETFEHVEQLMRNLETLWGINDKKQCPVCQGIEQSIAPCSRCNGAGVLPVVSFHKKKLLTSMFRRLIPMGVATGGVWTMNLRSLRHIMALRTHPGAEEEIARVMHLIGSYIMQENKILFADFKDVDGQLVPDWPKV